MHEVAVRHPIRRRDLHIRSVTDWALAARQQRGEAAPTDSGPNSRRVILSSAI
jgi:hypothetical protein